MKFKIYAHSDYKGEEEPTYISINNIREHLTIVRRFYERGSSFQDTKRTFIAKADGGKMFKISFSESKKEWFVKEIL